MHESYCLLSGHVVSVYSVYEASYQITFILRYVRPCAVYEASYQSLSYSGTYVRTCAVYKARYHFFVFQWKKSLAHKSITITSCVAQQNYMLDVFQRLQSSASVSVQSSSERVRISWNSAETSRQRCFM